MFDLEKPVVICAQGPSLKVLDEAPDNFFTDWAYWASFNRFWLPGDRFLKPRGIDWDILYCSSQERFAQGENRIEYWLAQSKGRMFVTNSEIMLNHQERCPWLLAGETMISDFGYGFNSLAAMLLALIRVGFKSFLLFGVDGHCKSGQVYFEQERIREEENFSSRAASITRDALMLNDIWDDLLWYWNLPKPSIVNANPDSFIKCWPKVPGSVVILQGLIECSKQTKKG